MSKKDMKAAGLEAINPEAWPTERWPGKSRRCPKREEAALWLLSFLRDGPVLSKELYAAARESGIRSWTLMLASNDLGIIKGSTGWQGGWFWSLPKNDS